MLMHHVKKAVPEDTNLSYLLFETFAPGASNDSEIIVFEEMRNNWLQETGWSDQQISLMGGVHPSHKPFTNRLYMVHTSSLQVYVCRQIAYNSPFLHQEK